jgi:hypothetical protein
MMHIKFRYQDQFTRGNWSVTECYVRSLAECIKIYGLNEPGVKYEIIEKEGFDEDRK